MQSTDNNIVNPDCDDSFRNAPATVRGRHNCAEGAATPGGTWLAAGRPGVGSEGAHPQRLSAILGASLFAIAGPTVLNTIATASFVSLQVLLEIGRFGAVAYQIFGR
jgi:hypothetical protein